MNENGSIPLSELNVLLFDCQATGANPSSGHVLEMAWAKMKGKQTVHEVEKEIHSSLVRLPDGQEIPPVVSRITGIKTEDLQDAAEPEELWQVLKGTVARSGTETVPMVIHFYRYESPFLKDLHERFGKHEPFPFNIICTYRLIQQLLPALPRKSLRAVAGYLGHSVQEFRRSFHHVSATAMIWHHAVRMLARENVFTLTEMNEWLEKKNSKKNKKAKKLTASTQGDGAGKGKKEELLFPLDKEKRKNLPGKPGIYRYLRSNGDLLYIGKATSLKQRVNSYFHKKKGSGQARLTMEMLTQAADIEYTVTGSALEAAVLENDEIKRCSPPYNVALRKRDREIAFFSYDLSHASSQSGTDFPLGPLPSSHSLTAFINIMAHLEGRLTFDTGIPPDDQEFPALFLSLNAKYAPGMQCFKEGMLLFQQNNNTLLEKGNTKSLFNALMILGKELRRKQLEEMEKAALEAELAENSEGENEDELNVEEERVWLPEDVERMLCGIIRYAACLIRRSRWFRLLSQSALSWETGKTSGRTQRVLVIQDGDIVYCKSFEEEIETDREIPEPPGYTIPFEQRSSYFDVLTYDRLRVLTTEIRRLVSDSFDRQLQLKLSPNVTLAPPQLLELFKWI